MSRNLFIKMSALTIVVVVMIIMSLAASDLFVRTLAASEGVIVQLQGDPVIVAKTMAEASGQNFDPLEYRRQLIAEQDQFLNQLRAAGISFTVCQC